MYDARNGYKLEPMLKWPGGKQEELPIIVPAMPDAMNSYYEPFLGGGAVYLTISSLIPALVNDKSEDLIELYQVVTSQDAVFFSALNSILSYWELLELVIEKDSDLLIQQIIGNRLLGVSDQSIRNIVDGFLSRNADQLIQSLDSWLAIEQNRLVKLIHQSVYSKLKRMHQIEEQKGKLPNEDVKDNIEASLKAGFYYYIRHLYNQSKKLRLVNGEHASLFFFIRENAYASMFRFNSRGEFNIPYGGITYNRKNLRSKVENLRDTDLSNRLRNTVFCNMDFADFFSQYSPSHNDFIFLDPPYDSDFNNYDKNPFKRDDQVRLSKFLINDCHARFMLVIKSTPFILSLYEKNKLNIRYFDKKYMYTIKERNNRNSTHLLITNY